MRRVRLEGVEAPTSVPRLFEKQFSDGSRNDKSATSHRLSSRAAASDVTAYVLEDQIMNYRGADNHIHQLFKSATQWVQADLTNLAGVPLATGNPFGYIFSEQLVVYNGTNGDIHQLYNNGGPWADTDLSMSAGAPPSAGDPFAYIFGNQAIVYRGTNGDIHLLFLQ
jgi:hypothetical protein